MSRSPRSPRDGRPPAMSEEDEELWNAVTGSIEPLSKSKPRVGTAADTPDDATDRPSPRADRPVTDPAPAPAARPRPPPAPPTPPLSPPRPAPPLADFDRKKARRIAAGREEIDARIDLHGMRQTAAHAALRAFLLTSHAAGRRTVLVITGKGAADRRPDTETDHGFAVGHVRGVLKRNVPRWLAEPELRAIIISYRTAAVHHGGEGALYIHLRALRKVTR